MITRIAGPDGVFVRAPGTNQYGFDSYTWVPGATGGDDLGTYQTRPANGGQWVLTGQDPSKAASWEFIPDYNELFNSRREDPETGAIGPIEGYSRTGDQHSRNALRSSGVTDVQDIINEGGASPWWAHVLGPLATLALPIGAQALMGGFGAAGAGAGAAAAGAGAGGAEIASTSAPWLAMGADSLALGGTGGIAGAGSVAPSLGGLAALGAGGTAVTSVGPALANAATLPSVVAPTASLIPGISNNALLMGAGGLASLGGSLMSADATRDAANQAAAATNAAATTAANATLTGQREAIAAQERMLADQRRDFAPFLAAGQEAVPQYQQFVNGNEFDLAGLAKLQSDALTNYKPTETEAYNWQKKRGLDDLRTQLMLMGRPSGTVAANANARFLGDLNATEYDKGYNRLYNLNDMNYNRLAGQRQNKETGLLNLLKTGQGAAASTGAASQNFANNASNTAMNTGTNLANIFSTQGTNNANAQLVKGQNQANLYSGLANLPFSLANTAIQGGWQPFA